MSDTPAPVIAPPSGTKAALSPARKQDRAVGLAFGRVIACVMVIAAHQNYSYYGSFHWLGSAFYLGFGWVVPFFLIASAYFYGRARRFRPVLKLALTRLLPIFAAWVVFYLFATGTTGRVLNNLDSPKMWFWLLAEGGEGYHLWFLSSLGASLVAVHAAARFLGSPAVLWIGGICFVFALALGSYAPVIGMPELRTPELSRVFPFYPVVFVAFGFWAQRRKISVSRRQALALTLGGIIVSGAELCLFRYGYGIPFTENDFAIGTLPFGIGMFFLFRDVSIPHGILSQAVRRLAPVTLGIYAVHLFILKSLEGMITTQGLFVGTAILCLTFILSAGISLALRNVPVLSRFTG